MKEGITSRVARLVSASVHGVVDRMEQLAPEAMMEQTIREIEAAIDEVRAELGRVVASHHLTQRRLEEERQKYARLGEQAALAVAEQRDDLASAAIARQMDIEVQLPVLERAIAEQAARGQELEGYVVALRAKQREMREELNQFRAARAAAPGGSGETAMAGVSQQVERANSAFERAMGVAGATPGAEPAQAAKLAELEELARQNRIRERLAALKAGSGQ